MTIDQSLETRTSWFRNWLRNYLSWIFLEVITSFCASAVTWSHEQLINGIPNQIKLDIFDQDGDIVNITIISPSDLGDFVRGKDSTVKIDKFTNQDDDVFFVPAKNAKLDKPGLMTISFTDGVQAAYEPLRLILRQLTLSLQSPGSGMFSNLNHRTVHYIIHVK